MHTLGLIIVPVVALAACSGPPHERPGASAAGSPTHRGVIRGVPSADSALMAEMSPVTPGPISPTVANACDAVALVARVVVGPDLKREDGSFTDSFRGDARVGCRLHWYGVPTVADTVDETMALSDALAAHGWAQDLRYMADGPNGSDVGLRRLDVLCELIDRVNGGDDTDTTTASAPPDSARLLIVECARDVPSNADAGVPDSVWHIASAAGMDSLYAIDVRLQYPPYLTGDFDGDGPPDAAVLVQQRATGKVGVAFVLAGQGRVVVAGAGTPIVGGSDDLSGITEWDVFHRGVTYDIRHRELPRAPMVADALWIASRTGPSRFIHWTGHGFVAESHNNLAPGATAPLTGAVARPPRTH